MLLNRRNQADVLKVRETSSSRNTGHIAQQSESIYKVQGFESRSCRSGKDAACSHAFPNEDLWTTSTLTGATTGYSPGFGKVGSIQDVHVPFRLF